MQVRILTGLDLGIAQEERRQAEHDRAMETYPQCCVCKHSLFGHEIAHEIGNQYICDDCWFIAEEVFVEDLM